MRLIEDEIAIVGMACVFAGSPDIRTFWENNLSKRSCISDHPDPETRKFLDPDADAFERIYSMRGGYLGNLARFDPVKHGIMPADVKGGDPDQFLALGAASAAIADAGLDVKTMPRDRVEVILGHSTGFTSGNVNWFQHGAALDQTVEVAQQLNPELSEDDLARIRNELKRSLPPMTAQTPPTLIPSIIAGRIANRLDLLGCNYIVDAACASSHIAVANGMRDLLTDNCDYVLAGGAQASLLVPELMLFCEIGALSRRPELRPFDKNADGTMLGEGVGVVLLRRRRDAEKDGSRIYAIVKGIGVASDGRARGLLAPRLEGQKLAIQRAYAEAGVDPRSVGLIEAHGTGIPLGDATELAALSAVFGPRVGEEPTCGIGSVKSMIGHCRAAAGIAGLIKAVLALNHKILPPSLNCEVANPALDLQNTPFYINTKANPWIHGDSGSRRRAGVSAMGFGGIDAHCVLEEYLGN